MYFEQFRSFIIRHRIAVRDLGIILAGLAVGAYIAFDVDIFFTEGQVTPKQQVVELDEALLLGGLLAIAMLIFAIRRFIEQKKETQRRIRAEQYARELAFQDALTGLANRRQFDDSLKAALDAPPSAGGAHALFLLDLDGFKQVNDIYGHGVGDEVLIVVAQRLRSVMRESQLVARFGGDEFAVLATQLAGPEAASSISLRIIQALEEPIKVGTIEHRIGAGIGMTLLPHDATTVTEALRKADVALYRAKAERRSAMRFFEEGMDRLVQERAFMERELHSAVESDSISLSFRPTVNLKTNEVVGFEVEPRWIHGELGELLPERFIPIAEETGLIHRLTEALFYKACTAAKQWPDSVMLSFDIYSGQLTDQALSKRILEILESTGLSPKRLELDITESALVHNLEAAQVMFTALREKGVRVALDNFGTGYSSLYHLRNFQLDKIKIDRSFIENIDSEQKDSGIVQALAGLGQGFGFTVSAAGVEDLVQRAALISSGCEQAQGGLFSEALTAGETVKLIEKLAA